MPKCGRKKKVLKIGCWNVRTLQDNGSNLERRTAIIALELSRYDLDIVALRETRFADEGQLKEPSGGYTFFWKGKDLSESRTNGVGFALKNHIAAKLESLPKGINDRLMVLRLPIGKTQYATFVSAYIMIYRPMPLQSPTQMMSKVSSIVTSNRSFALS